MTPPLGLEPRIFRLEVGRVIQLRHEGFCIYVHIFKLIFLINDKH